MRPEATVRPTHRSLPVALLPVLLAVLLAVLLPACDGTPGSTAGDTLTATERTQAVVRLDSAEAARLARMARESVSVQLAAGLELTPWAAGQLVADPYALDVDSVGTVYITSSGRSSGLLDIRGHPDWVPEVHTLRTVEDLRRFYRRVLAPERSAQNGWLPDRNEDGSRDWRDLSEEKERVYRIQDANGDGLADVFQVLIEGFNEDPVNDVAGGLLVHGGAVYVAAAPDVWRLRDTDGDGALDVKTSISHGFNTHPVFFGHGLAGMTVGPDGRLYWSVGDMGLSVVDRTGRRWSYPNQGAIMRANPDGSDFEVFAAGLRNSQAIAFDEYGNLIGVDNDGDHPGETERLVYITDGSDAGWRSNWQYGKYTDPRNNGYKVWMEEGLYRPRFDGQAAYIVPPIAPHHAGPATMVHNPGTALGEEWRGHFLVSSFPGAPTNARIHAFRLSEQGAGFELAKDTVVLQGILTVGMKFGPDGALYLADWIDGWASKGQGRIWKLDAPAAASRPLRTEVRTLLGESFARHAVGDLRARLGHVDARVRRKAQFELVRRADASTLLAAARDDDRLLARVHALWGLGQLARADTGHAARLVPFLRDTAAEVRAQAARVLGDVRHAAAGDALLPLLRDGAPRPRFFAAQALGRIAHEPAVPAIVAMLAENDDRDVYLRHAGSLALARVREPAPVVALAEHPSRAVRLAAVVALRRMRNAGVARFLADADEHVVTEAARAINDDAGIPAALPALARMLVQERVTNEPLLRRAISANLRLGTPEAVERVAAFAARANRPDPLRVDAVATLGVWPRPSVFDRVDGIHLGAAADRDPAAARAAVTRLVAPLLGNGSAAMKIAMAEALGQLELRSAAPALLARLRGDASAGVRVAALRALQAVGADGMGDVVRVALADRDVGVRTAALGMLPALRLPEAEHAALLASVIRRGTVGERQSALEALGTLRSPQAEQALGDLLDQLGAGTLAPELQLDLVEAVQASGVAPLQQRIARYRAARSPQELREVYGQALLRGGDVDRGRDIAFQHAAAQCARCHTIGPEGADVGPDLSEIGARLSREQLLEALLEPSARIAPGYGSVSVTLRDGRRLQGVLQAESATHLVVQPASGAAQRIARREIAQRANAPSAMPSMAGVLNLREIRDVVEFLRTRVRPSVPPARPVTH